MTGDPASGGNAPRGGQVLDIAGLSVRYRVRDGWLDAVRDISLQVAAGEAVALVGESGSGKSSVALAVLRYLPRNAEVNARRLALEGADIMALPAAALRRIRGARIGAVYQDPGSALNPVLTIGRQIGEVLQQHRRLSAAAAREASAALLDHMRVPRPGALLDLYPHELSGGLQQRVVIAAAIAAGPALLVLDEPTTALDASVRAEIIAILDRLRHDTGTSLLLISHDLHLVRGLADRVGVMHHGAMVEYGEAETVLRAPRHAYTRGLLGAVPRDGLTRHDARLASLDDAADAGHAPADLAGAAPPRPGDAGPVLQCLGVNQRLGGRTILLDIDLTIGPGETLGLIGESGSGKSTLARIIAGLQAPVAGALLLDGVAMPGLFGRRSRAQRRAVQMVFQSPDRTLNPKHRVGRNIARPLRRLLGLRGEALRHRLAALLRAVRLPEGAAARRPAALSGGQRQRVAIARAMAGGPRLLILDEPTSALDASVQAVILNLLVDLQRDTGFAALFISHDLDVVRYMADRVAVLYAGRIVETGPADRVFTGPCHPYTRILRDAARAAPDAMPASTAAPAPSDLCVFRHRCPVALPQCGQDPPPWREDGASHTIRCWHDLRALAGADTVTRHPSLVG